MIFAEKGNGCHRDQAEINFIFNQQVSQPGRMIFDQFYLLTNRGLLQSVEQRLCIQIIDNANFYLLIQLSYFCGSEGKLRRHLFKIKSWN